MSPAGSVYGIRLNHPKQDPSSFGSDIMTSYETSSLLFTVFYVIITIEHQLPYIPQIPNEICVNYFPL